MDITLDERVFRICKNGIIMPANIKFETKPSHSHSWRQQRVFHLLNFRFSSRPTVQVSCPGLLSPGSLPSLPLKARVGVYWADLTIFETKTRYLVCVDLFCLNNVLLL